MIQKIVDLISSWEKEKQTEYKIVQNCIVLIKNSNYSRDFIFDVNDALRHKGYCYQFMTPKKAISLIDEEYFLLTSQTSKSLKKTEKLIEYLKSANDFRISFASLHCLRIQNLILLGYLSNASLFNSLEKENVYNVYFSNYQKNLEIQNEIENFFDQIGIHYLYTSSYQFKVDMEYLLWSMNKKDHTKKLFIKQNTIRVAFSITPKEVYEAKEKVYYDENIVLHLISYLKLIDKSAIQAMKTKYESIIESIDVENGYIILFYTL